MCQSKSLRGRAARGRAARARAPRATQAERPAALPISLKPWRHFRVITRLKAWLVQAWKCSCNCNTDIIMAHFTQQRLQIWRLSRLTPVIFIVNEISAVQTVQTCSICIVEPAFRAFRALSRSVSKSTICQFMMPFQNESDPHDKRRLSTWKEKREKEEGKEQRYMESWCRWTAIHFHFEALRAVVKCDCVWQLPSLPVYHDGSTLPPQRFCSTHSCTDTHSWTQTQGKGKHPIKNILYQSGNYLHNLVFRFCGLGLLDFWLLM